MKKTLPTSGKARSRTGWHKHLRKDGKRLANRGTRQIAAQEDRAKVVDAQPADDAYSSSAGYGGWGHDE